VEQQIHFCTTHDGTRIAYATVGEGPPIVKAANWLSHLEADWQSPIWRHMLREFARDHTFVRYDERGNGLSDWNCSDLSFNAWVDDLESVVEAAGLDRFPLLGISQGGGVAIAYAVRHPEKVSHLILYGAYARGWARRDSPDEIEQRQAQLTLVRLGWGKDNPAFRQLWTSLYAPDATPEQAAAFNDLQRVSTSPANAVKLLTEMGNIDVADLLPQVRVPTLVLHCRDEAGVPFEEGRKLAGTIPGARFVPLEGRNHLLLEGAPSWGKFVAEIRRFIGADVTSAMTVTSGSASKLKPDLNRSDLPDRYTIISFLGVGGMGEVYLAEDTKLGRKVALKTLPAEFTNDRERLRRFHHEARAASALNHPNLLTIHEIGSEAGAHFIAAEYIDGETLRVMIKRGPLKIDEALDIAQQAAFALTAAHGAGIVHRDIKPENIMVRKDGIVKVLDFGLAKLLEDHARDMVDHEADTRALVLTDPGRVLGTPQYMSPEQTRGADLDARTDIWSLGVVLYEMIAGRAPFRGETRSHTVVSILEDEPPPLTEFAPNIPAELLRIVRKALTKDSDSRYQTARDMMIDLKNLRRELDIQSELKRSRH
jgi:pimeloyl-ACP methyl ester carboxylesterase